AVPLRSAESASLRDGGGILCTGLSARYAGAVDSVGALRHGATAGHDGVREVPVHRWDLDLYWDRDPASCRVGRSYARHGGFVEGAELFDAACFGVATAEAASMDPAQRLLLEVGSACLQNGGLPLAGGSNRQVAVV
ncbi:unnamed protein product, partial [Polarella glacialis]